MSDYAGNQTATVGVPRRTPVQITSLAVGVVFLLYLHLVLGIGMIAMGAIRGRRAPNPPTEADTTT